MNNKYLPMSRDEMAAQGIQQLDYIVVTPDAYVDHPSFAAAIIGRFVQNLGYSVGVIAQPDWESAEDVVRLGAPRFAFLLSGGNIDGMVNMYTAAKRKRSEDSYSPGGKAGRRPARPTIAYTARIKQAYHDIPVIIGGVEASNRRFAHYDYYEDKVRRSYLVDSKADMLVFGMGEAPLADICARLKNGEAVRDMLGIRGTCVLRASLEGIGDYIALPSYERTAENKKDFADACRLIQQHTAPRGKVLAQAHGDRFLIQFPPPLPLSTPEMDAIYGLPFTRRAHPSYTEQVPALAEVQFGLITVRGCPGQCAFCSISAHQGKRIQKRSKKSIVEETRRMAAMPEFKGVISDVGGPTANFYDAVCTAKNSDACTRSCLTPQLCPNLRVSHKGLCELLEAVEKVDGVNRVFIRSGLRYDYIMADKDGHFFERLVKKHVSGQLKVAPEHVSGEVLRLMNKPDYAVYERFSRRFASATKRANKPQYLLPYYISSHPGSTLGDAIELALTLKKQGFAPEQVQDFYPTPGTVSTCMFHTGLDPMTGKPVYVAKTPKEKAMQRALLQFDKRKGWPLIREALREAGREDLIGQGGLVPSDSASGEGRRSASSGGADRAGRTPARTGAGRTGNASKSASRAEDSPRSKPELPTPDRYKGRKAGHDGPRQTGRADGATSETRSGRSSDGRSGASERRPLSRPTEGRGARPGRTAGGKTAENRPRDMSKPGMPPRAEKPGKVGPGQRNAPSKSGGRTDGSARGRASGGPKGGGKGAGR